MEKRPNRIAYFFFARFLAHHFLFVPPNEWPNIHGSFHDETAFMIREVIITKGFEQEPDVFDVSLTSFFLEFEVQAVVVEDGSVVGADVLELLLDGFDLWWNAQGVHGSRGESLRKEMPWNATEKPLRWARAPPAAAGTVAIENSPEALLQSSGVSK